MFKKGDKVIYEGGCTYADGDNLIVGKTYIVERVSGAALYIDPPCCPLRTSAFKREKPTNEERVTKRKAELCLSSK